MLNVSQAIKDKFQSDLCRKELRITIGSTVLTNSAIYKDGFKLTESVMDGTVEFVGCIASILEFKISTLALAKGNYKGQTVTAEVAVYLNDNSLSSYIPLFHGFVDECTKSADGYYQQFICYDRLAYLSDEPGYNMYKAAFNSSSVDLQTFRDAIVLDCGMDAVNSQVLPNDDIIFRKRKRNKDITAMALLRHIAQINGAFGILNRDNRFEFKQIDDSASPESVLYYRDLKYSDYVVKPVGDSSTTPPTGSITIRTNSQDAGVTVDWTNYSQYAGTDPGWSDESQDTYLVDDDDANVVVDTYVIEGNLISYKLKAAKKRVIGANILASLGHDAVFREHTVKCNGLPYVECCDKVLFTKADSSQIEFVVTKRVLEGVQDMTDTYSCTINSQDANNKTFVSNVNNSTNNLGGSPDEALGLIEKTITVNGTYSANDDGAEGYSQVNVNVPGGGTNLHAVPYQAEALEDLYEGDLITMIHSRVIGAETAVEVNTSLPANASIATNDEYIFYSTGTDVYRIPIDDLDATPELWKSYSGNVICFWKYISCSSEHLVETTNGGSVTGVSSIDRSAMTAGGVPAYMVNGDKGVITPDGSYTRWGVSETGMNPGYPISGSSGFVDAGIYHVIRPASYDGGVETYIWHGTSPNYWYLDVPLTIRDNTVYFCINGNLAKMGVRGSTYTVVKEGNYSYPKVGVGDAEFTPVWWDTPDGLTTSNNRRWTNVLNLSNIAVCFSHYCWTGSQMWDLDPQPLPKRMYKNYADHDPAIPDGESLVGIGYVDHFIAEGETDEGLILFF